MNALEERPANNVKPLGEGRFSVTIGKEEDGERLVVEIHKDKHVTCECRAARQYNQRCVHIADVLTYVAGFTILPERVEVPSWPDVAQMSLESISRYVLDINRATNVLTVKREQALIARTSANKAVRNAKALKAKLVREGTKGDLLEEAFANLVACENALEDAKLACEIISMQMEEMKNSRISALSMKRDLRE